MFLVSVRVAGAACDVARSALQDLERASRKWTQLSAGLPSSHNARPLFLGAPHVCTHHPNGDRHPHAPRQLLGELS